jgi:hypothetical protein
MHTAVAECERAGHDDGLAAGLALSGACLDHAPGRVAAVPTADVPADATVLHAQSGVSFVRAQPRRSPELTAIAGRLAAVRLGLTIRLAERVVEHLSGRTVGGEPTISKQLVLGALADARVATEVARRTLTLAGDRPDAVRDVHERLTTVDWELAKMLGASSFAGAGLPEGVAMFGVHLSRLTANCWTGAA